MRSNYFAEAVLVIVLIFVGAGALVAWTIVRSRGSKNAATATQPANNAAVAAAAKSVQKYAPYYLRLGAGDVVIDRRMAEAPEPTIKGPLQQWIVTGSAFVNAVDGQTFQWVAKIDENDGKMTLREIRINGELIFEGSEPVALTPAELR